MSKDYTTFNGRDPMEAHIKDVNDPKYLGNLIDVLKKIPGGEIHLTMARERLSEICLTDNF
jgi:hypothetical protein|tara:strand:- start:52 stop:234 length:183 start_codon:yes stop_codon:yes gene_type:complete